MIATHPALFVTFVCARDKKNQESAVTPIITHLARSEAEGGLALLSHATNQWSNSQQKTWAWCFVHPELPDVELLQVVLNPGGDDATPGFLRAWKTLEQALKEMPAQESLVGRTLVYQAALPPEREPQAAVQKWLATKTLLASNGHPISQPRAYSQVTGGHLWLLATPCGIAQESIYLALGAKESQETLNLAVLFGKNAALIWPDAVAHKAYLIARDYLATDMRQRFRDASDALMEETVTILQQSDLLDLTLLDKLSRRVAKLATVIAELRRLHSGLEIHQTNYERSLENNHLTGGVSDYHRLQIKNRLIRIKHDLIDANAALEAANTAINTLRTKYEQIQATQAEERNQLERERAKQEARANHLTNTILTILAVTLTVPPLIDRQVTDALWAWWEGNLTAKSYNTLQVWGVQLGITIVIGAICALLIVALSRAIRNR